MTPSKVYIAADLGAESGRLVSGAFDGDILRIAEVHRFPNTPIRIHGHLHWNILGLHAEILRGLAAEARRAGDSLVSLGVDTWGVDYGLLDAGGRLIGFPYHYRDSRTEGMMEECFRRVPKREIYDATGIQFMFLNTLYQVLSEVVSRAPALEIADRLLFTPDLFHFWLTGEKVNEKTIASTSQMFDTRRNEWASGMLGRLGIPSRILGPIVEPGTVLGKLRPEVADETGARKLVVVAPGSHDTASAVAAVPAGGTGSAYLSSGTWSLMGTECREPVIDELSYRYSFTNELGVCGTVRLLKNISGLWIVQECRRAWASEGAEKSYEDMTRMAEAAPPFAALIDADYPPFAHPGEMPAKIEEFCRKTGQATPGEPGAVIRSVLEGLAFKYRTVLGRLEELVGRRLAPLHIVGGGSKNRLLNQLAADALNRTVIAGPVEATSAGNILLQMVATGELRSLEEGRELIRRSFATEIYEPREAAAWDEAYQRYLGIEGTVC